MTDGIGLLDQGQDLDSVTAALVTLDRVTRERLDVAEVAADTLERLTETGALAALDRTVAVHLVGHARGLTDWLCELRSQSAVHSEEECLLTVRRLERRLGVVLELLDEAEEAANEEEREGAPFAGDFAGESVEPRRRRKRPAAKRLVGRAAIRERWQARRRASNRQLRLATLAACGALFAVLAVAWNGVTVANTPPPRKIAAPGGMQPAAYVEDMRLFMPVTATMKGKDTLSVIVDKSWLVKPVEKRREDALGAHTYLLNRNVPRLILRWADGEVIASFDRERMSWHEAQDDGAMAPPVPIDWH